MNQKEIDRLTILNKLIEGSLTQREAASITMAFIEALLKVGDGNMFNSSLTFESKGRED